MPKFVKKESLERTARQRKAKGGIVLLDDAPTKKHGRSLLKIEGAGSLQGTDLTDSKIACSPRLSDILDQIQMMEGHNSWKEIFKACKLIDADIGNYDAFRRFVGGLNKQRKRNVARLLRDMQTQAFDVNSENSTLVLKQLTEVVYSKIFQLGNVAITQELEVIREQLAKGEPLSEVQRDKMMKWFFYGADSLSKARGVDAREMENEREQSIVDALLANFQYGKLHRADVVEADFEEKKPKALTKPNVVVQP